MPNKNEKVKIVYDKLVQGVQNFKNTNEYITFLKFIKNFHNYSFSNKVLIYSQFENATKVAGYKTWEKLGRKVIPGSKGIQILSPRVCKIKVKAKDDDDDTEKEEYQEFLQFRPVYVFDVSQTEGEPLPELKNTLNTNNKKELFKQLETFSPFPIQLCKLRTGCQGYFNKNQKFIALDKDLSYDDKASVLIHELTHGLYDDFNYTEERDLSEIFVESVAYIVADYFNLDTSMCSFNYINSWAQDDVKKVIDLGNKIQNAANSFIEKLEFEFTKGLEVAV